jgi:hypothetical protein
MVDVAINNLLKTLGHSTPAGAATPMSLKAESRDRQHNGAMNREIDEVMEGGIEAFKLRYGF